jgi:diguanylate cyclase
VSSTSKAPRGHFPLERREIAQREALVGIKAEDAARLARCWDAIRPHVGALVTGCLGRQLQVPGVAAFVTGRSTRGQIQRDVATFLESVFRTRRDATHAGSRVRIGLVHRRIGLPARFFLAALHHLRVGLSALITTHIADAGEAAATLAALERRLLFDESLIIDAYEHGLVTEARREHDRASRFASTLESQVAARTRELEQLSRTDALTGLRNRRAFHEELAREISRSRRQGRPLAALYIDVDDFKALNDREGHSHGDEALAAVAATLARGLREIDVPARLGGDEFCVLLPDTDQPRAAEVAARLRQRIRAGCPVTVSIGAAVLEPRDWDDPDRLIERSDAAMYRDKARLKRRRAAARPAG